MENGMLVQEVSSNVGTNIDSLIRQISNKTKFLLKGMAKGTKLPGLIKKEDKQENIVRDSSPIEKSPSNIQSTAKQSQVQQQDDSSVSPQRKKFDMQDKMKQFTKKRDSSADEPAPQAEALLKIELKDLQDTRKQLKKAESKEIMSKPDSNAGQVNEFLSKFQKITQKGNKQEDAIDQKAIPPEEQKVEKKVETTTTAATTDNQPKQEQRSSVRLMPIGLMKEGSIFQNNIFLKDKQLKPIQQSVTQAPTNVVKEKEQTSKVQQMAQRLSETQQIKESVSYQSQKLAANVSEIQKTKEQKIDAGVSDINSIHSSDQNSASMKSLDSVVEQQPTRQNMAEGQREEVIKREEKTVEKQPELSQVQRNRQQQSDTTEADAKSKNIVELGSKSSVRFQQIGAQTNAKPDILESQNTRQEIQPLDKGILSPFQMLKLRPVNKKQVDSFSSVESNPAKTDNINKTSLSKPAINVIDASRKSTSKLQAYLENDIIQTKQTDNKPSEIPAVSGNSLIASVIIKNADSNTSEQQDVPKDKNQETAAAATTTAKRQSIHKFVDLVDQLQLQQNAGMLGPTKQVRSDYGEDQPPQSFEGIPPNPLYSSSQQFDDVPDLMKSSVQSGNATNLKTPNVQHNILGNSNSSNIIQQTPQQQYSQQQNSGGNIITPQLLNNPGVISTLSTKQLSLQATPKDLSNIVNFSPASQAAVIPLLESPIKSNSLQNPLIAQLLNQQQQLGLQLNNMQQQQILLNQTSPLQQQYQQQFTQQSSFTQSEHPITYFVAPQSQQQPIQPVLVLQPNQLNFSTPQQFLPPQVIPIGYQQQQLLSDPSSNLTTHAQQVFYQQPVYQFSPQQVLQAFPSQSFQQSNQFQQGTPQGQIINSQQSNQQQSSPNQPFQMLPGQPSFQNPQVQPFLIQSPISQASPQASVTPQYINSNQPSQHSNASQFAEQRSQQQLNSLNISPTQDISNFNQPTQEGPRQAHRIYSAQDEFSHESGITQQQLRQNIPQDNSLPFQNKQNQQQQQQQYSSQQGNSPPQSQYFSKFSFSHPINNMINSNIPVIQDQRNKYPQHVSSQEAHVYDKSNSGQYQIQEHPESYQDNSPERANQQYPPLSDSSRISRLSIHTIKTTQDQGRDSVLITDMPNNFNQSQQQSYYAVSSQHRGSQKGTQEDYQLKRQQPFAASSRQFANSSHIDDLLHEANSLRSSKQPTQTRMRPQSMNFRAENEELNKIDQNIRDLEKSIDHLDDDLTQGRIHLRNKSQKDYSKAFMTKTKEISTELGETASVTNRSASSKYPRNQGGIEVKRTTNKSIPVLETTLLSARKNQALESRVEEVNLTLPRNSLSQPRYSNSNKKGERDIITSEFPTQRESYGAAHLGFTSERSQSMSTKNMSSSQFQFVSPKKAKRVSVEVFQEDTSFTIANRFFQTIQRNPSSTQIKKLSAIIETQINAYCEELSEIIGKVEVKKLKERDTIQCFFREKSITSPKQIAKEDSAREVFGQVKINYQDRQLILKVRNEDDPDELAFNFITENNLPKSKVNLLIQQIVSIQQQQRIKQKQKIASFQRLQQQQQQQQQQNSPTSQQLNSLSTTWKRAGWQKEEDSLKLEKRQMLFQFKFELGEGAIIDLCVYEGDNLSKLAFELAQTYKLSLEQYQRIQECLEKAKKAKRETSWQRVSKNI